MSAVLEDLLSRNEANDPGTGGVHLGPGRVVRAEGDDLRVAVAGRVVRVRPALACRYEAAEGDVLLVAGQEDRWYAVGVLSGRGRTVLEAPGDLEIRAPRGEIALRAARGFRVRAPRIAFAAAVLEARAQKVTQHFGRLRQRITEALEVEAGELRTRVVRTFRLRAGSIVQRARGDVKVDGRQIRLG